MPFISFEWKHVVSLGVALNFIACSITQNEKPKTYGASIGLVNHTNRYIYATQVGDVGGGHAARFSAGVPNICCVILPEKWHAGLKLSVRWDMPEGTKHIWKEKDVSVEEYTEPGSVYLHFFPDDDVRVVVTDWVGGSSKHPIPPPVDPSDNK